MEFYTFFDVFLHGCALTGHHTCHISFLSPFFSNLISISKKWSGDFWYMLPHRLRPLCCWFVNNWESFSFISICHCTLLHKLWPSNEMLMYFHFSIKTIADALVVALSCRFPFKIKKRSRNDEIVRFSLGYLINLDRLSRLQCIRDVDWRAVAQQHGSVRTIQLPDPKEIQMGKEINYGVSQIVIN